MIDIRKLKELVRLMVENDLSELDLQDQQETVSIKRGGPGGQPVVSAVPAAAAPVAAAPAAPAGASAPEAPAGGSVPDGCEAVSSPMVGTFYTSADRDSPPFVKVGETVTEDTTVCLVEAMKVFNEIKAGSAGTIEKVLVKNGESVEFGQDLFVVRPA